MCGTVAALLHELDRVVGDQQKDVIEEVITDLVDMNWTTML